MSACVGHDPRICAAGDDYERRHPQVYEVRYGKGPWRALPKREWVTVERSAGFHNTMGHPDHPATGGFSTSANGGIEGRVRPAPAPAEGEL